MNNPIKYISIESFITNFKADFVGLIETKLSSFRVSRVNHLSGNRPIEHRVVDAQNSSGGLAIF